MTHLGWTDWSAVQGKVSTRGTCLSGDATRKPDPAASFTGVSISRIQAIHGSMHILRVVETLTISWVPRHYDGALKPWRGPRITLCGAGIGGLQPLKRAVCPRSRGRGFQTNATTSTRSSSNALVRSSTVVPGVEKQGRLRVLASIWFCRPIYTQLD
jgi:hypothetical protein